MVSVGGNSITAKDFLGWQEPNIGFLVYNPPPTITNHWATFQIWHSNWDCFLLLEWRHSYCTVILNNIILLWILDIRQCQQGSNTLLFGSLRKRSPCSFRRYDLKKIQGLDIKSNVLLLMHSFVNDFGWMKQALWLYIWNIKIIII